MKEYKPTEKELKENREEEVRICKMYIKSLICGLEKYARGSNVEGAYLQEKIGYLVRDINKITIEMREK